MITAADSIGDGVGRSDKVLFGQPETRRLLAPGPWTIAFVFTALASLIPAELGYDSLALVFKGVPNLVLLGELARPMVRGNRHSLQLFICIGLFTSFVADYVIAVNFVGGIAAFLLVHLFYLAGMGVPKRERIKAMLLAVAPAAIYFCFMFNTLILSEAVPAKMMIPVIAYMTIIILLMGRAWIRGLVAPADFPSKLFMVGVTIFVLSDSLIAFNKWVFTVPHERLAILGTYYLAQYLISRGALVRRLPQEEGA